MYLALFAQETLPTSEGASWAFIEQGTFWLALAGIFATAWTAYYANKKSNERAVADRAFQADQGQYVGNGRANVAAQRIWDWTGEAKQEIDWMLDRGWTADIRTKCFEMRNAVIGLRKLGLQYRAMVIGSTREWSTQLPSSSGELRNRLDRLAEVSKAILKGMETAQVALMALREAIPRN